MSSCPQTLRTLYEEHPEWRDLPIVVYVPDGSYDWVGAAGDVYTSLTQDDPINKDSPMVSVLVFSAN